MIPSKVRQIYEETYKALINNLPIVSTIGMRALVEAVCMEKSASGNNIEKRIDDLVNKGVLTTEGADILHSIRLIGNKAAWCLGILPFNFANQKHETSQKSNNIDFRGSYQ